MTRLAQLILLLVVGGWAVPGAAQPLWGDLRRGPHPVGFQMSWEVDAERQPGGKGRAIQVWRWYPARAAGARMTIADYAQLATAAEIGGAAAPAGWPTDPRLVFGDDDEMLPQGGYDKLKGLEVAATPAAPGGGRFPLIVLAQGYSYEFPIHQHVLAEYLASHGYVVVTAPLTGAASRRLSLSPQDFDAQVRDMAFLLERSRELGNVDAEQAGLFGFDLGGMAAVALAAEEGGANAVAGFDSGVLSERLIGELLLTRPGFSFDMLRVPYLHATRLAEENRARQLDETLTIFHDPPAERVLVRAPRMRHADFALPGAIEAVYPDFFGPVAESPTRKQALLLDVLRQFFDRHLKGAMGEIQVEPPLVLDAGVEEPR